MGVLVRVLKSNVNVRRESRGGWAGRGGMEILTLHLRDGLSHHPIRDDTHTCITQNKFSCLSNKLFFFYLEDVPSNTPRRMAQPTADPNADLGPATLNFGQPRLASIGAYLAKLEKKKRIKNRDSHLSAKLPPVKKPEMMAFHGSSFCLYPLTAQSKVEKRPPQTPKLPPRTGARALIAERDPTRRSPCVFVFRERV